MPVAHIAAGIFYTPATFPAAAGVLAISNRSV